MATSTTNPYAEPTSDADDQVWTAPGVGIGDEAGASGTSSSSGISQGAIIAIVVVVVVVAIVGALSAVLFFLAKKREWKVREKLRKSARKVVTAMTPRRSQFPRESRHGRTRIADDVPPTPRMKPEDLEKGKTQGLPMGTVRNWSRKS